MQGDDIKRISRLTALLTLLQSKRIWTAAQLADKFGISKRTVYRDIKTLEQAGVPVYTEEGKGYRLMEGYRLPPVMFTESQANALILAEQLVLNSHDDSLVKDYSEAIDKIKSVLNHNALDKVNLLQERSQYLEVLSKTRSSNKLSELQVALTNYRLVKMQYTNKAGQGTERIIEPFAIVNSENWYLIAWCRLQKEFRFFRPDRIEKMEVLNEHFSAHKLSLQEFFEKNT